jgi:23S rRNA (uracil1939-C5)-methyltransferase
MGELVKTCIEGMAAGGDGIGRIEGKTVFIDGGVPGETVLCRVTEERHSWSRAELIEVINAVPERVQPQCIYYGVCGGCNFQHLNYSAQCNAKTAVLRDAFIRIGGVVPPEPQANLSEPWEYRNRMQFHVLRSDNKKQSAPLGLKARKSADIIPVADCPIADPGIRELLQNGAGNALSIPPEKDRFAVYSRNGLLLNEGGVSRGRTQILDKTLTLDAGVFFQSNGAMLEKLAADLRNIAAGADQNRPMADLYCGVGTFAAFLADLSPRIDLVEENKAALALARENLSLFDQADFFARRSEDWAKNAALGSYGFIVADPPRQGLNPALTSRLAAEGPPLFAYVSCDPATLARDSKILLQGQYELAELRWYDFYPQTAHIESLAVFSKK